MYFKVCIFLFILFFSVPVSLFGQRIENFEVLPDANYTLNDIRTIHQNKFFAYKRGMPITQEAYWIRFVAKNETAYSQNVCAYIFPMFHNTLFYYNYEKKSWSEIKSGLEVYTGHRRNSVHYGIILKSNSNDTLYVKVKTKPLLTQTYQISLSLHLQPTEKYIENETSKKIWWITTMGIMLSFFLYNFYIYIVFRDVVYLYYLLIVVGGIIYITGLEYFVNEFWQFRTYQIQTLSRGRLYHVELSSLITNIGIIGVMTGFVYFTRHYLQLRYYLPTWDKMLRVGVWVLTMSFVVSDGLTFGGIYYADNLTHSYHNILTLLIILGILSVGVLMYVKGYKPAKYFLIANTIPLCLMMGLAIYFNLNHSDRNISFFSNLAIIFQALALAIALVARINLLKEELKQKQLDVQIFQNENERMVARNQFIELENEYILAEMALKQNEKEQLQAKLEANQRELASNALYIYQKNELLVELKKQIERLSTEHHQPKEKEVLKEIKSTMQSNIHLESDWEKFKIHFEQVNPTFFQDLSKKCSDLTPYEIRLSAYLHLNMSTKEIATLLNINPESVYKAKTRLNKKLEKANNI